MQIRCVIVLRKFFEARVVFFRSMSLKRVIGISHCSSPPQVPLGTARVSSCAHARARNCFWRGSVVSRWGNIRYEGGASGYFEFGVVKFETEGKIGAHEF